MIVYSAKLAGPLKIPLHGFDSKFKVSRGVFLSFFSVPFSFIYLLVSVCVSYHQYFRRVSRADYEGCAHRDQCVAVGGTLTDAVLQYTCANLTCRKDTSLQVPYYFQIQETGLYAGTGIGTFFFN